MPVYNFPNQQVWRLHLKYVFLDTGHSHVVILVVSLTFIHTIYVVFIGKKFHSLLYTNQIDKLIILRQTIKGYSNSFDFTTFEKIISKQNSFVLDRNNNLKLSKIQNEIYRPLVTRCSNTPNVATLFTKRLQEIKLPFIFFAANLTWSLCNV